MSAKSRSQIPSLSPSGQPSLTVTSRKSSTTSKVAPASSERTSAAVWPVCGMARTSPVSRMGARLRAPSAESGPTVYATFVMYS